MGFDIHNLHYGQWTSNAFKWKEMQSTQNYKFFFLRFVLLQYVKKEEKNI